MFQEAKKNYLGIDWGASDVGVALAHEETGVAVAYETLRNDKNLLEKLGEIIAREDIGVVVIGIPSHVNRTQVEYAGEKLGKALGELFFVEVVYQNEMFTTKLAQQNLIHRGVKQVSLHDDEEAAKLILEGWLEKRRK
ncbi:MAG: Holliday junction resolvase RuvX [Candidatus Moranbacteria bacterium]|nr:Holliday junction resolvase RuvX [Candidatus Moranbacteria bacterium]